MSKFYEFGLLKLGGLVAVSPNGTAKISSRITAYYSANGNIEAMSVDIEENIISLLCDKYMAAEEIYNLLMNDKSFAAEAFKTALKIYSEIWCDEPELIEQKILNLKETALAYGIEI